MDNWIIAGIIFGLLMVVAVIWYFVRKQDNIVLKSSMDSTHGYTSLPENLQKIIHAKGKAITPLVPSGVIEIEGVRFDAQSRGEFIEKGQTVEVIGFDAVTPVVRIVNE